jgi:hypothetical protein
MKRTLLIALLLHLAAPTPAAEEPTFMTVRGKLVHREDFSQPLPRHVGKPNGYASGFEGWLIHGTGPESRGGQWKQLEGRLHGSENPQVKHPATASYGIRFDALVLQCRLRMEDVPLDKDPAHGRKNRYIQLRFTNEKSYLCTVSLHAGGFGISKDDNDRDGPDQRVQLASHKASFEVGKWHTVVVELMGDEVTATVDGHSATGRHPALGQGKHSFMVVTGPEGSISDLRLWEAKENPQWPMNRAVIASQDRPIAPAAQPASDKK